MCYFRSTLSAPCGPLVSASPPEVMPGPGIGCPCQAAIIEGQENFPGTCCCRVGSHAVPGTRLLLREGGAGQEVSDGYYTG